MLRPCREAPCVSKKMASVTSTNSRAAVDWAAKRRQAMERAAAIKAERQAHLRESRANEPLEGIEGVGKLEYF